MKLPDTSNCNFREMLSVMHFSDNTAVRYRKSSSNFINSEVRLQTTEEWNLSEGVIDERIHIQDFVI